MTENQKYFLPLKMAKLPAKDGLIFTFYVKSLLLGLP
jgi:hypothetical protein